MTPLDLSEHSLNLYPNKKRIVKRVIFHGRQQQYGGEPSTFNTASEVSAQSSMPQPTPITSLLQPTSISSQLPPTADGSDSVLSLATSQPMSIATRWATVTVTLPPTIVITTATVSTTKRSRPTSTGGSSADVQSAQASQNQQLLPTGTVGAVIMSVLFAVMMGFVLYVARKRFGFPRRSPLSKLRKDAMAARMTNAILEPKNFGGRRPIRTRSILSLVTLSSFRRGRSRPGSQISSVPPFSPAPASLTADARPPQSSSAPVASTSRSSSSNVSESAADVSSSFHAFLASGSTSRNHKSENSLPPQQPLTMCAEVPDDLDTPIFLTASPKSTAFGGPRK
ncbi:hypothetical protein BJ165DRAFT_840366 [Panaeolus papilionaceus]|nr:hypothetical protein BJ165DRAFT_840366 [Panaeolus papilionaceus]